MASRASDRSCRELSLELGKRVTVVRCAAGTVDCSATRVR